MNIEVPQEQIEAFCRRWKIREFALFGSVLRDDFRPDSDVDVMVAFAPDAEHSLFDVIDMENELRSLFGRDVDLLEKGAVVNPFVRDHIRRHHEVMYRAADPGAAGARLDAIHHPDKRWP